jgi:hypothetical protein
MQAPEIGAARIREDFRNLQNANFWHVRFCAACAVEWNISPWLGFEVDYQFELRRLLDRQVNGPFALEYPPQDHPDARVAPAEVRARPGPTASGMRCFVVGRDRREHIDRCGLTNGERRVPFS